jgi:hypothetical protein
VNGVGGGVVRIQHKKSIVHEVEIMPEQQSLRHEQNKMGPNDPAEAAIYAAIILRCVAFENPPREIANICRRFGGDPEPKNSPGTPPDAKSYQPEKNLGLNGFPDIDIMSKNSEQENKVTQNFVPDALQNFNGFTDVKDFLQENETHNDTQLGKPTKAGSSPWLDSLDLLGLRKQIYNSHFSMDTPIIRVPRNTAPSAKPAE